MVAGIGRRRAIVAGAGIGAAGLGALTILAASASLGLTTVPAERQPGYLKARPPRRKPKPYIAKIKTAAPDERADKYLHSAARRRRAEERAASASLPSSTIPIEE